VKIQQGARVRIKVKLQIVDGEVVEESVAEYFHGAATIIPGLERRLAGLEAGAERRGVIPAAEAFSAVADLPTKKILRREFPEDVKLQIGEQFQATGPKGQQVTFEVMRMDDAEVEARFVHPLAGKDIAFEVTVLSVTDPTPPPLPGDALGEESEEDA